MDVSILKKKDYKTEKWSGGETTEIFIYPEDSTLKDRDFYFRVSSATCSSEKSLFSDFSDYNRYITTLNNELILYNKSEQRNIKPYQIFFFDGSDKTYSESSVTDFNLIIKKGLAGSLRSESIDDAKVFISGKINIVFFPKGNFLGEIEGEEYEFDAFDSLLIKGDKELRLRSTTGANEKILIVEVE